MTKLHRMQLEVPVLLSLFLMSCSHATRILLMPFPSESHMLPYIAMGEALMEKGGFEIYMMLPSQGIKHGMAHLKGSRIKVLDYPVSQKEWKEAFFSAGGDQDAEKSPEEFFNHIAQTPFLTDLKTRGAGFGKLCERLLQNQGYHKTLASTGFDHAIVDAHPFARCYYVLLYKLGIPYSSYMQEYDPWLIRAPALPSFAPSVYMERSSEVMGLWERVLNLWTLIYWSFFNSIPTLSNGLVSTYAADKPYLSLNQLARESSVWLSDTEFLLDYPRPVVPNEFLIGGLTTKPAGTLPKLTESFLSPNGTQVQGAVVVHLGNEVILPAKTAKMFADTFNALSGYRTLWQYKGDASRITAGPNLKISPWLPLNDILGHEKTKLFITAAGTHDQQAALYHGVPMLSIPIEGIQRHNAQKARYQGYGLSLDILTSNAMDLLGHIKKILASEEFEVNANKASVILKSRPEQPSDTVSQVITLAIDDQIDHLKSHAMEMPWYQYLMLDVFTILFVLLAMCLWLMCNTVYLCVQKLRYGVWRRPQVATLSTNGTVIATATHPPTQTFKPKQF